jgi:hypothetical protein
MGDDVNISSGSNFTAGTEEAGGIHHGRVIARPFGVRLLSTTLVRGTAVTAYAQGGLISNLSNGFLSFANVTRKPNLETYLNYLALWTDDKLCSWLVRAHLYSTTPTAKVDYDPFSYLSADVPSKYLGSVDIQLLPSTISTNSNRSWGERDNIGKLIKSGPAYEIVAELEVRTLNSAIPVNGQSFGLVACFG